jgi:hypothetical protein
LANAASISLEGLRLFYYEAYELQFDEDEKAWEAFEPEAFATEVVVPISKKLEGFDIASFTLGNMARLNIDASNHRACRFRQLIQPITTDNVAATSGGTARPYSPWMMTVARAASMTAQPSTAPKRRVGARTSRMAAASSSDPVTKWNQRG